MAKVKLPEPVMVIAPNGDVGFMLTQNGECVGGVNFTRLASNLLDQLFDSGTRKKR